MNIDLVMTMISDGINNSIQIDDKLIHAVYRVLAVDGLIDEKPISDTLKDKKRSSKPLCRPLSSIKIVFVYNLCYSTVYAVCIEACW